MPSTAYTTRVEAQPAPKDDPNTALAVAQCGAKDGSWSFTGKLRNDEKVDKEYRVKIEVKAATGKVLAEEQVSAEVAAGETAPVKSMDFFTSTEDPESLTCDINIMP